MQDWLQRAETHSQCIEDLTARQETLLQEVERIVHDAVVSVVAEWQQYSGLVDSIVNLKRFGSRHYMCALPTSDFDLVCEMPARMVSDILGGCTHDCHIGDEKAHHLFLERLRREFQRNRSCELGNDAIQHKTTFVIKHRELSIDVTATTHPAQTTHLPYRTTTCIKSILDELPPNAQRLARLMTDVVKHTGACVNGGRVSEYLKGVHWVLLVIAWWRMHVKPADGYRKPLGALLHDVCQYYVEFPFETTRISATNSTPMMSRSTSALESPILLVDPIRAWNNLASHIDLQGVAHIRSTLSRCCQRFQSSPQEFWQRRWKTHHFPAGGVGENLPQLVTLWHEHDEQWTPALCILCREKSEGLFRVASNLCTDVLHSCPGQYVSLLEEDIHDDKIKKRIASLGEGFNTQVRKIVVQGGRLNGLTLFGAGDISVKRSRASKLSLAVFIRAVTPPAQLEDPTRDGSFGKLVRTASIFLEGMQGQVTARVPKLAGPSTSSEQPQTHQIFEQEHRVDLAITPEQPRTQDAPTQNIDVVAKLPWSKYVAPDSLRIWFCNDTTGDWFFPDDSGPWSVYRDDTGRRWWWRANDDWFYEDLANN